MQPWIQSARDYWQRYLPVLRFWCLAVVIGVGGGGVAVLFRFGIEKLQAIFYQTDDPLNLSQHLGALSWYWVFLIPILGGLCVGVILNRFTPDGRVRSVADVIEGSALNDGRVEVKAGLASAAASLITLSSGGSTGREGPVVHLVAVISTKISNWIGADGVSGRDLLGCAVAAGVSASFNAPIAGALFALEVILRHFAVHAFAPIVIASVTGTVIARLALGNVTEFSLPVATALEFYAELPAFFILGLICGLVAVALMKGIFWTDDWGNRLQTRLRVPGWLRPGISGALLGIMAIWFPHIIGVGYETTSAALTGTLTLSAAIIFTIVKCAAVSVTMAGRMGGGVFSPALMVGAMTGLAFGLVATSFLPMISGGSTLYALAGMGAVAAAVLGAPISTTLIVFELTGDWQTGLAVMVCVAMSTTVASRLVTRSFFLSQLERRNVHVAAGPQAYVLAGMSVANVMRDKSDPRAAHEDTCWEMIEQGIYVDGNATLDIALPIFDRSNVTFLPVVTLGGEDQPPELWGSLFQVDALKAFNNALAATAAEEHS